MAGLEGTGANLVDIIVTGSTEEEHLQCLEAVLQRLEEAGLRVSQPKSNFKVPAIEFLGDHVEDKGVRPTAEKVKAIAGALEPSNKKELQAFLGMLSFYSRFLQDRAFTAERLH